MSIFKDERFRPHLTAGNDSFDHWPTEVVIEYLAEIGYVKPRRLEDGSWSALYRLAYTLSVCMGITPFMSYTYRWCFEDPKEAGLMLDTAKEMDEVPEVKSSLRGHRYAVGGPLYREKDERGFYRW